ncbi:MAG TPA: proton-conducting membrane transporter [Synergistaceae bacterium]|nr:proton-conducting membrane transporter [Synergistaceae bacterium]
MRKEELIRTVFDAGIVGAGGAGFPTHRKFTAEGIDTYLINGIECEPLLEGDCYMMAHKADSLVRAARAVEEALGAKTVFCLKAKHDEAVQALRSAGAEVIACKDYYPLGDEVIMIYEALGRIVPEGGLPLDVGVVVNNVETLYNIDEALQGRPVMHSFVSTGGAVARKGLFRVPLGTSVRTLLEAAGGVTIDNAVYVDGGPMMGVYHDTPDFSVTKTMKAILALPGDSLLARMERMPVETMLKQARVCCCQCNQCTLVCSRDLVGFHLEPHQIMRAMAFQGVRNESVMKMAMLCSECNLCSALHACPMGLSPRRVNMQIKKAFREQGITPRFERREMQAHPLRDYRLVPSERLKERLGLIQYEAEPYEYYGDLEVDRVAIPLKQHAGPPASPIVVAGDAVELGQCIATPLEGALGARIHASIGGVVDAVTPEQIVLSRQR